MHFRSVTRDVVMSSYPMQPYSPGMYERGYAGTETGKVWERSWFLPSVALVLLGTVTALAFVDPKRVSRSGTR